MHSSVVHFVLVSSSLLADHSAIRFAHLARGHEETERRRVVVLEEVERKTALGRKLDGLGGASLAVTGRDNVAVTRHDGEIAEVLSDGWCVAVGSLLVRNRAQLAATKAAGAREGVVGGGQVLLLREEEDNGALLSGVFRRDVEVEDRASGGADFAKVGSALRDVGLVRGDGDDQVRSLVSAGEASLASRATGGGSARACGWRSLRASCAWLRRRGRSTSRRSRAGLCHRRGWDDRRSGRRACWGCGTRHSLGRAWDDWRWGRT